MSHRALRLTQSEHAEPDSATATDYHPAPRSPDAAGCEAPENAYELWKSGLTDACSTACKLVCCDPSRPFDLAAMKL